MSTEEPPVLALVIGISTDKLLEAVPARLGMVR